MTPQTQECRIQLFTRSISRSLTNTTNCSPNGTPNNTLDYRDKTSIWRSKMGIFFLNTTCQNRPTTQSPYTTICLPKWSLMKSYGTSSYLWSLTPSFASKPHLSKRGIWNAMEFAWPPQEWWGFRSRAFIPFIIINFLQTFTPLYENKTQKTLNCFCLKSSWYLSSTPTPSLIDVQPKPLHNKSTP